MSPNAKNEQSLTYLQSSYSGIWKYPTNRDVPRRMPEDWLDAKRKDDNIGNLWRVFDKLYDLTPFIPVHPGGSQWLEMSRGTDITEAFVASHVINTKYVEKTLETHFIREINTPRISPFTLKPDGFYMTLKRRVEPIFSQVGTGSNAKILLMQDSLILGFLTFAYFGAMCNSVLMAIISGIFLGLGTIGAHNFFHLKENWRRYYFDLSLLSSYEWRITHAFSHHLYPNTVMDMELRAFPYLNFLPKFPKHWTIKYIPVLYSQFLFIIAFWLDAARRILNFCQRRKPLRLENLLVLGELLGLWVIAGEFWEGFKIWIVMHTVSSYVFCIIALHAGHHHPDIFHDGDEPLADQDFGIGQLDATRDRTEGIFQNLFVTLITFGHHPLHHLFPTVCHSKLDYIKDVVEETVEEYRLNYPGIPQLELYAGCYQQLARTEIKTREK